MNLKQLETFALVAELGSLSRAAVVADVAQSLISRQLAQLEAEWGDRLFERTGRGSVLSEFGRRVQPEINLLLEQARRLEGAVKEAAGVPTGTVHLGVLPSMSRELLPLLFADVRLRAPAVRLHVTEGFSGDLDEQLASGRLDISVVNRYASTRMRGEDVLGTVESFAIGKPGNAALAMNTITLHQLAKLPLVLPTRPNGLRTILDQLARQRGIHLDIVMEVDTLTAMKDVAASGHAYTILPLMAVSDDVASGRVAVMRIVSPGIKRTIALGLTNKRPLSMAARMVATRVRALAVKLLS